MSGQPSTLDPATTQRRQVAAAARQLSQAGIRQAGEEANVLFNVAGGEPVMFQELIDERRARVPLEHLTGVARFRNLDLLVGPGVFVPQPETACVVQWAVDTLHRQVTASQRNPLCVDLCTGTGTIALSLAFEVPETVVHAVEVDPAALEWATRNKTRHSLNVTLHNSDLADALPDLDGQCDLVISNPPYVATGEIAGVRPESP